MSRIAWGLIVSATVASSVATALQAQSDVAYLRRQYEAVEARRAEVARTLRDLRRNERNIYDDSVQIGARRVAFVRAQLSDADLQQLTGALNAESDRLRDLFGKNASAFADSAHWGLHSDRTRFRKRLMLRTTRRDGRAIHQVMSVPLDSAEVATMARTSAASALAQLHPHYKLYVRGEVPLDTGGASYARAAQTLALGGSSLGERCLAGSLEDCRAVLDPDWTKPALDVFWERKDYVELVRRRVRVSAATPADRRAARDRCVDDGDLDVCESLLRPTQQLGYPFRDELRGTLAVHAAFLGGEAGVDRARSLEARSHTEPLDFFAFVAGVSEDELLQSWHRSIVASRALASKRPVLPVALTSFVWAGLLGVWAVRRRNV